MRVKPDSWIFFGILSVGLVTGWIVTLAGNYASEPAPKELTLSTPGGGSVWVKCVGHDRMFVVESASGSVSVAVVHESCW